MPTITEKLKLASQRFRDNQLELAKQSHTEQASEGLNQKQIWDALHAGAVVPIRSMKLNETILWVLNDQIRNKLIEEDPTREIAIYTLKEVELLIKTKPDLKHLKKINEIKKILWGAQIESIIKES